MSDFLKKFKSVFVQEDSSVSGSQTTSNAPTQATESTKQTIPANVAPPTYTPPSGGHGAISEKFVEVLASALEKSNQEGFDYFEFRQSLINLAKMPMDEQTRFQSAFAMAQTMGVTAPKLIDSAKYYLQILSGEQSKFAEAHAQQRVRLIGSKEDEIKNLEGMLQQKTEQIKQLTQQIEEHRRQSEQIKAEINDSTVKIEKTKSDFDATYNNVVSQLQGDVTKIQQYLK